MIIYNGYYHWVAIYLCCDAILAVTNKHLWLYFKEHRSSRCALLKTLRLCYTNGVDFLHIYIYTTHSTVVQKHTTKTNSQIVERSGSGEASGV